jgi:hypothetical protein
MSGVTSTPKAAFRGPPRHGCISSSFKRIVPTSRCAGKTSCVSASPAERFTTLASVWIRIIGASMYRYSRTSLLRRQLGRGTRGREKSLDVRGIHSLRVIDKEGDTDAAVAVCVHEVGPFLNRHQQDGGVGSLRRHPPGPPSRGPLALSGAAASDSRSRVGSYVGLQLPRQARAQQPRRSEGRRRADPG